MYAQEQNKVITLASDQVHTGDYFAFGETVEIYGKVDGDVYAAGENVFINGEVTGDILVAGQDVNLSGTVGQDVRAAGLNVYVDGNVKRNLTVAAFSFTLLRDAVIERNAQIVADTARVDGTVQGDTHKYTSENAPKIDEEDVAKAGIFADGVTKTISVISTLIFGYILLRLFPEHTTRAAKLVTERFGKSLLIGLIGLIVVPVLIIILLVTIVGIPLALLLGCLFIVYLFLTRIYVMVAIGEKLTQLTAWKLENKYLRFFIGVFIYYALSIIPVLGGLVKLVVLIAGFGAALTNERESYKLARKAKVF